LPHHPRTLPGRFLAPNGRIRTTPLREMPIVADEPEQLDRIREAKNIRDEPECIGPAILTDWAEVNRRIFNQQHALDVAAARELRPMLDAEDRVRDIQRRAKYAHVDLSREVLLMRRDILRAKAGNRRPPLRVLDRCERLESLLDGIAA
jgi:hypothetical protein